MKKLTKNLIFMNFRKNRYNYEKNTASQVKLKSKLNKRFFAENHLKIRQKEN